MEFLGIQFINLSARHLATPLREIVLFTNSWLIIFFKGSFTHYFKLINRHAINHVDMTQNQQQ